MTYAYQQDVPIKEDVYTKIMERLGRDPLPGCLLHLVLRREDGTLRYVDVWESKEACDRAFADRVHPAVYAVFKEIGFKPAGEPTRTPIEVVDIVQPRR